MAPTISQDRLGRPLEGGSTVFTRFFALALTVTCVLGGVAGVHAQGGKKVKQTAVITLEKGGEIRIEFFPDDAPKTVENFVTLAKKGFYDGLAFHRVVPGFVVQGGDPKGDGTGGPGYKIKAEFNKQKHVRGSVAMARAQDPDSAGSQFYITFGPQLQLDGQYTVFGRVVAGMELVDKIKVGDKMKSVRITEVAP
ncbi:MAG: peptidylprolyl isomerase [Candidatus Rokubacteria bacterium]|nr:peptidylprolyl isomerase [Candidatus Rokubacteria bacterium]